MLENTEARRPRYVGIRELSLIAGVTARTLRFYESKGLIRAGRDRYNVRRYDELAINRALMLTRLRQGGLSLPDAAELLELHFAGQPVLDEARRKIRMKLSELERAHRAAMDLMALLDAKYSARQASPVRRARALRDKVAAGA